MSKLVLNVPAMYADHHVLRVRDALLSLDGVEAVTASAAKKQVVVDYNEDAIYPDDISDFLAEAGYRPNDPPVLPEMPERSKDGSPWHTVIHRRTTTLVKD
jgi:copper chaperone CopZ